MENIESLNLYSIGPFVSFAVTFSDSPIATYVYKYGICECWAIYKLRQIHRDLKYVPIVQLPKSMLTRSCHEM